MQNRPTNIDLKLNYDDVFVILLILEQERLWIPRDHLYLHSIFYSKMSKSEHERRNVLTQLYISLHNIP